MLVKPDHSLLDQSLLARELYLPSYPIAAQFRHHAFPTNGDGFGMAWVGREGRLGQFRQLTPAWDSQNLRHLAAHIVSGCFLAHVRAAPGGTIAEQNCHPFVQDGWMFQHNGEINGFGRLKRDLTMDVHPDLYPSILGNGDTEVCFFLALTYGLADDPVAGMTRMVHRVERARRERGIPEPFRATMCASDGTRLVVLRWVSPDAPAGAAPSLFHSAGAITLHSHAGEDDLLPADAQVVVSEPLELRWNRRTWHEIPDAVIGVFQPGQQPVFTSLSVSPSE
ncbi:MAG: class II glutamine amidotransferase [Tetrasphaera sp.]